MAKTKSSRNGTAFMLIFALFWSAIVLCFDVLLGHALYHQIRAQSFARTEGRILSSEVTRNSDSDGTTYGAEVTYEYTVDGRRYEADRVRYGAMSTSDGQWARQTVRENQPGSVQTVYYDPREPADSVLQTGLGGQNWFMLLFLSPFNAVMIFLWSLVVLSRLPSPPAGGARIVSDGDRVLVKLNPVSRGAMALFAFGGVCFVSIFILAFTTGFSGDSQWTLMALGIALAVAAWFGLKPAGRTTPDLVIDPVQGRLELPKGPHDPSTDWKAHRAWKKSGNPPLLIPLETLRTVTMSERIKDDGDGKSTSYVTVLCTTDPATGATTEHDLGSWMLANRAESFTVWLRETLGVPREAQG